MCVGLNVEICICLSVYNCAALCMNAYTAQVTPLTHVQNKEREQLSSPLVLFILKNVLFLSVPDSEETSGESSGEESSGEESSGEFDEESSGEESSGDESSGEESSG